MSTDSYNEFRRLMQARAFEQAADLADAQIRATGERAEFWWTQSSLALNAGGKPAEALVAAERGAAIDPTNPYLLLARADALRKLARSREALADYREALRSPRTADRAEQGIHTCLFELEDWQALLTEVAASQRPPERLRYWRAKALRGLGRNDEAMAECRAWLAAQPDHPPALWEMVELEIAEEGLSAVRERYSMLARIPSRPRIYKEIHASLCRRAGDTETATTAYVTLAQIAPDAGTQRKAAFALAKSGREQEAIAMFEELMRERPDDHYMHSSYAAACKRTGALERAWEFYGELLRLHPDQRSLYGRRTKVRKQLEASEGADST